MTEPVLVTKPSGADNSRVKKIGVIGGVFILAIFVLPKVLGGGGDSGTPVSPAPGVTTPTTIAPVPRGDVQAMADYGGTNPFTPLVDMSSEGGAAGTPVVADSGPLVLPPPVTPIEDFGDLVDVGDPVAGGETPSSTPTTPTTAPPPPPTHRLSLLEVYVDGAGHTAARVRVDDDVMETVVGQQFGGNYRTVSLDRDSGCGVFLYGDQRVTLCEGNEAIT